MTDNMQQTLGDTLEYLVGLWRENVPPEEARARLGRLQGRHGRVPMDLVWEEESYSQSVHYDVLLHPSEAGTVSLSFCPDRAVPWPLRRAQHSRESEIARVNCQVITVQMVMDYLDFIWDEAHLITRLVDVCLMQDEIERRQITVSEDELQEAMDDFRRRHRLCTGALTENWLRQHGKTQEGLEHLLESEVAAGKLRDQIAGGRVEDYYSRHESDFDTVWIARFRVADQARGRRVREQIDGGELSFFEAAAQQFCDGGAIDSRLFAVVRRGELSTEQAGVIFDAPPGSTVGPVPSADAFELVSVLRHGRAGLDEATRSAIKEILLVDWLAQRRRESTVDWFWGDTTRLPCQRPGPEAR